MKELVTVDDLKTHLDNLKKNFYFNRGTEVIYLENALNRELAEDVYAEKNLPDYDMATMDGYAVKYSDSPSYKIKGEIFAGSEGAPKVEDDEAYYISTGAKMPEGADTVIKIELAEVENNFLHVKERIKKGKYVLKKGSEVKKGELILEKGRKLGPHELAVLKSIGREKVEVYRKLRIGIFSTGDEIKKGIIKDCNSIMIQSFLKLWNCDTYFLGIAADDYEDVKSFLTKGLKDCDMVFVSGGVSVGKKDYVIKAIEEIGEIILYKVKQRPGKPMVIGKVSGKLVFGLPGKPVGAFLAMLSIRSLFSGCLPLPTTKVKLGKSVKIPSKGFKYIVFVKLINGLALPVGYKDSPIGIFPDDHKYEVSLISNMPKTMLADGFFITEKDVKGGVEVEVMMYG